MDAALSSIPDYVPPDRVVDFDIYADPRVDEDVQGSYARILADAPDIFWTPRNGGHWIAKRYDVISEIVRTPEVFSTRQLKIPRMEDPPKLIPLYLDPPENIPFRQVLMPLFSPKAVKALEGKMREWAELIVGEVADKGECDFAHDVASVFPVTVFMELMGMPRERLREFRSLADSIFKAHNPEDFGVAYANVVNVLNELIAARQAAPGDDIISILVGAELPGLGRKMTLDELQRTTVLLFLGGMDTVTNVSGFTYQNFAQNPALQRRLVEHPELIPDFVEEGLRLFGVANGPRMVVKDCEMFGVEFRTYDMVLNALCISGRDDRLIDDPNTFDIDRPSKPHLTFSSGPHLCVGHNVARAEIRILTEEWLKRIPSFRAKPGVKHRFRLGTVNALESLPLEWPAEG